jgi:Tfp pilus assembly protein PilO
MRKEKGELEATKESLEAESAKIARDLVEFKKLAERSEELKKIIEENQRALPTGAELPAFFETLNRKIGEAGVEVKKWEYKKEIAVETFFKVPLEIEVSGTFHQLKRFFASLIQRESSEPGVADRDRIISIENLQLTVPKNAARELQLTAKFTASTFRQGDPEPSATPKPAKPKPKAAAPKPAGPAATPAPAPGAAPAAAPAGAKGGAK